MRVTNGSSRAEHNSAGPSPPTEDVMAVADPTPADRGTPGRHAGGDADRSAAPRLAAPAHDRSWLVLLPGAIVTFVFGLVVLAWPKATLNVVAVLLGGELVVFGLVRLLAGGPPGSAPPG